MTSEISKTVFKWVNANAENLSRWNQIIWELAEPAWREYESVNFYIDILKKNGFKVERNSAGMPTAFHAEWGNGNGPNLATYAEYDAVPGQCQAATTYQSPRENLSQHASGHTDPHSALGISALGGLLATKATMEKHNIKGTLCFTGEPAEKLRGSKPIHAAHGYYDGLDAMISFHPCYMIPWCNTVRWNIHCGAAFAMIYRFESLEPENWLNRQIDQNAPIPQSHSEARTPGANDALFLMYSSSRSLRDSMLPHNGSWSMNEIILTSGQATADNLAPQISELQYMIRVPTIEQAQKVTTFLDNNASAAAKMTNCKFSKHWISKSRPGLPNHAISNLVFEALKEVGTPVWGVKAKQIANDIRSNLGLSKTKNPFLEESEKIIDPKVAEEIVRKDLPPSQLNFTSDDYTEMCWHVPTARLYIARPMLAPVKGFSFPNWVMNALGGIPETIDPMIMTAAKTIGLSFTTMLTNPDKLKKAKNEFTKRTGGGIHGSKWIPPLCDYDPPIHFAWPDYIQTKTGKEWWLSNVGY
ncbi:MAG: amidohydrolase [Paracoccaceae bacterium]|nr:amidohydrolase [Paracoccaceae bacterium]